MQKSHLVREDEKYLRFDDFGKTSLVSEKEVVSGYSYRKVHYTHED